MAEAEVVTVESSDEGEENSCNLTSEEAEERCQTFANVTGTDTALAMFYLQDRDWNVEASLDAYFQSQGEGSSISNQKMSPTEMTTSDTATKRQQQQTASCHKASASLPPAKHLTTAPPVLQPQKEGHIRILSWNIDGLDPDNLQSRTQGVCSVLKQENPEVIFLQEVVQRSLTILQSNLTNYHFHMGYDNPASLSLGAYFTALLVRKDCVDTTSVSLADFPSTKMARNLLEVKCRIHSIPVKLLTSHLESTAEYREERQRQLRIAFDQMKNCGSIRSRSNSFNGSSSSGGGGGGDDDDGEEDTTARTTIFGGDLNLRDKELSGVSSKPPGIYDIWECTGKRPEAKFTWDLSRNDNKQLHGKFQPRCRFDRMFIAHPYDGNVRLKPAYFELVGIQRLASCRRFPSDHWGILSHFSILD